MAEHKHPAFPGEALRRLRLKIGLSRASLANIVLHHVNTIARYEKHGTTNADYVKGLVAIVEHSLLHPVQPVRRGRPIKEWHVAQPRRGYSVGRRRSVWKDYAKSHHRLFLPDHPDHMKWLTAPPACNDVAWLRLCNFLDNRDSLGTPYELHVRYADGREEKHAPMPLSHWYAVGKALITKS